MTPLDLVLAAITAPRIAAVKAGETEVVVELRGAAQGEYDLAGPWKVAAPRAAAVGGVLHFSLPLSEPPSGAGAAFHVRRVRDGYALSGVGRRGSPRAFSLDDRERAALCRTALLADDATERARSTELCRFVVSVPDAAEALAHSAQAESELARATADARTAWASLAEGPDSRWALAASELARVDAALAGSPAYQGGACAPPGPLAVGSRPPLACSPGFERPFAVGLCGRVVLGEAWPDEPAELPTASEREAMDATARGALAQADTALVRHLLRASADAGGAAALSVAAEAFAAAAHSPDQRLADWARWQIAMGDDGAVWNARGGRVDACIAPVAAACAQAWTDWSAGTASLGTEPAGETARCQALLARRDELRLSAASGQTERRAALASLDDLAGALRRAQAHVKQAEDERLALVAQSRAGPLRAAPLATPPPGLNSASPVRAFALPSVGPPLMRSAWNGLGVGGGLYASDFSGDGWGRGLGGFEVQNGGGAEVFATWLPARLSVRYVQATAPGEYPVPVTAWVDGLPLVSKGGGELVVRRAGMALDWMALGQRSTHITPYVGGGASWHEVATRAYFVTEEDLAGYGVATGADLGADLRVGATVNFVNHRVLTDVRGELSLVPDGPMFLSVYASMQVKALALR